MDANEDKLKGFKDKAVGKMKEGFGKATDDPDTELKGKAQTGKGEAREGLGKAKDAVNEHTDDLKRSLNNKIDEMKDKH